MGGLQSECGRWPEELCNDLLKETIPWEEVRVEPSGMELEEVWGADGGEVDDETRQMIEAMLSGESIGGMRALGVPHNEMSRKVKCVTEKSGDVMTFIGFGTLVRCGDGVQLRPPDPERTVTNRVFIHELDPDKLVRLQVTRADFLQPYNGMSVELMEHNVGRLRQLADCCPGAGVPKVKAYGKLKKGGEIIGFMVCNEGPEAFKLQQFLPGGELYRHNRELAMKRADAGMKSWFRTLRLANDAGIFNENLVNVQQIVNSRVLLEEVEGWPDGMVTGWWNRNDRDALNWPDNVILEQRRRQVLGLMTGVVWAWLHSTAREEAKIDGIVRHVELGLKAYTRNDGIQIQRLELPVPVLPFEGQYIPDYLNPREIADKISTQELVRVCRGLPKDLAEWLVENVCEVIR